MYLGRKVPPVRPKLGLCCCRYLRNSCKLWQLFRSSREHLPISLCKRYWREGSVTLWSYPQAQYTKISDRISPIYVIYVGPSNSELLGPCGPFWEAPTGEPKTMTEPKSIRLHQPTESLEGSKTSGKPCKLRVFSELTFSFSQPYKP